MKINDSVCLMNIVLCDDRIIKLFISVIYSFAKNVNVSKHDKLPFAVFLKINFHDLSHFFYSSSINNSY